MLIKHVQCVTNISYLEIFLFRGGNMSLRTWKAALKSAGNNATHNQHKPCLLGTCVFEHQVFILGLRDGICPSSLRSKCRTRKWCKNSRNDFITFAAIRLWTETQNLSYSEPIPWPNSNKNLSSPYKQFVWTQTWPCTLVRLASG